MPKAEPAIKIEIIDAKGSTPRGVGATMFVSKKDQTGTIGGGALEWEAILKARQILEHAETVTRHKFALGPQINQCCGGQVTLDFTPIDGFQTLQETKKPQNIYIFGAGHVGAALTKQCALLGWCIYLVDERTEWLHTFTPSETIKLYHEALPERIINIAAPHSIFIITTHSHALDFTLTAAALQRKDARYIGMIGSMTKRKRFLRWAEEENISFLDEHLHCPMGEKIHDGKAPEIVALSVAHEIMKCSKRALMAEILLRGRTLSFSVGRSMRVIVTPSTTPMMVAF